jgi:hypothetical protein
VADERGPGGGEVIQRERPDGVDDDLAERVEALALAQYPVAPELREGDIALAVEASRREPLGRDRPERLDALSA